MTSKGTPWNNLINKPLKKLLFMNQVDYMLFLKL